MASQMRGCDFSGTDIIIMLENLSIMANMHVFWSLREGVFTFQVRFETGGYLASLKSSPWVTPGLFYSAKRNETKRNILGKEKKCLLSHAATHEIFPRLIVETAPDSVDSTLYPRNHNRSAAKRVLFSWPLGYSNFNTESLGEINDHYIHPSHFPKKIIGKIGSQEQKYRRFIGFKSQI